MNRVQRFVASTGAGYLSTLANLVYTVASVPLALHYLPKEEFALWALTVQIGGYLMLLDLGMSVSVSRFLADHKDSMQAGEYGKILRTGFWVFIIQAVGLAIFGCGLALLLPGWLEIPPSLREKFQLLTAGQSLILSLGLALRIQTTPLWAHQRTDITHLAAAANLLTSLGVMGLGFFAGWGVYSFLAGSLVGSFWTWFLPWAACVRFNYFPYRHKVARFDQDLFFRMLRFGKDVLIMQIGGLLCTGSQIILVTKLLGLEAAATFSVATKAFAMAQQLLGRVLESSAPGLTEMFVQGDRLRFIQRFYQTVVLVAAFALIAATAIILSNRLFVNIWTNGKVSWDLEGDIWLGVLLLASMATRALQGAFGMSGDLSKIRFLPLMEGSVFVILALLLGHRFHWTGIFASALLSHLVVSLAPTLWKVQSSFPSANFGGRLVIYIPLTAVWFLISSAVSMIEVPQKSLWATAAVVVGCILASAFWALFLILSTEDRTYVKESAARLLRF
jgi:O-antigen/teichoic acid export membrane protein